MAFPRIGITLGDPGGIGPEVTLKALSEKNALPEAQFVVFGSPLILKHQREVTLLEMEIPPYSPSQQKPSPISLYEVVCTFRPDNQGKASRINGESSFRFFQQAVRKAQQDKIQALVTAPVSKHSWHLAGIKWAGHTDYLSHLYPEAIMFFWSDELKVALFSHHLSLRKAIEKIKRGPLLEFFLRLHNSLKKALSQKLHYLVSGLNPHAGEQGLIGSEEREEIIPAIESAQKKGLSIDGPYPPDTVFHKALNQPHRVVIALYHDQGLIPFKLQSFNQGINVTLGLPFIRTSPDHGTAFDIAGQGIADPKSMLEAIKLAHTLVISS